MRIGNDILSSANHSLVSLLAACSDSDETKFVGKNPRSGSDFDMVARAVTQLVEICSWIGIMPSVQSDLESIMSYMLTVSAVDKTKAPSHPSRLKALLLYGRFKEDTLAASLEQVCTDREVYCSQPFSVQHLSYIDLLGIYLKLHKNNKLPSKLLTPRLLKLIRNIKNQELKEVLNIVKDNQRLTKLPPNSISYISWILLVNKSVDDHPWVKRKLRFIQSIIQRKMTEHSNKGHLSKYEDWNFPEISYGYLSLFWFQRHWNWTIKEDSLYIQWLHVCAEELRKLDNPYHTCLFIKQIIQARKEDFVDLYNKNAYSALRDTVLVDERVASSSMQEIAEEALRKTISIDTEFKAKLTAGWSSATVYRVKARIQVPTTHENEHPTETEYVIKLGTKSSITHASRVYVNVPEPAKRLFVRHQHKLYQGTVGNEGMHFIIMEYLPKFQELATLLQSLLPEDKTAHFNEDKLIKTVQTSLKIVRALHDVKVIQNPIFRPPKPLRVKIAELFDSEYLIAKKDRLLRNIIENGKPIYFPSGTYQLMALGKTLIKLLNSHGTLTAAKPEERKEEKLPLIHGDCHAFNIILRDDLSESKFIDLADVHIDDYLEDYAALCGHVCFSMNLEKMVDSDISGKLILDPNPLKPERLEDLYVEKLGPLSILWNEIFIAVESQANTINDVNWRARLSILIGRRLIFVASKALSPLKSYILLLQGACLLQQVAIRLPMLKNGNPIEIFVPPGELFKTTF